MNYRDYDDAQDLVDELGAAANRIEDAIEALESLNLEDDAEYREGVQQDIEHQLHAAAAHLRNVWRCDSAEYMNGLNEVAHCYQLGADAGESASEDEIKSDIEYLENVLIDIRHELAEAADYVAEWDERDRQAMIREYEHSVL